MYVIAPIFCAILVPKAGVEPARPKTADFESAASANFATPAVDVSSTSSIVPLFVASVNLFLREQTLCHQNGCDRLSVVDGTIVYSRYRRS